MIFLLISTLYVSSSRGYSVAVHKGAAGNVCAENLVGHPLPGSVMHGGSLTRFREARA